MQTLLPLPLPLADVPQPTVPLLPKSLRCAALLAAAPMCCCAMPARAQWCVAAAVQLLKALCHCLHLNTSAV
jgi:hypothetical protein